MDYRLLPVTRPGQRVYDRLQSGEVKLTREEQRASFGKLVKHG